MPDNIEVQDNLKNQPIQLDLGEQEPENAHFQPLVTHCLELYKVFSNSAYRAKKLTEIQQSHQKYEQDAPTVQFPWANAYNIYLPLVTISVDNLEPRLVAGLIGRDPIISFGEDTPPIISSIQNWYNKELSEVVKINTIAKTCVHTILLEGTYFAEPAYDYAEKEISDFQFDEETGELIIDPETGEPVKTSELKTVFEGGKVYTIPFSDMFYPDDLGTQEEWENGDKIVRTRPTYGELMLKKDTPGYMNIGSWLFPSKESRRLKDSSKTPAQSVAGVDITGKEVIECIKCYVSYPLSSLKEDPEPDDEQTDFREERLIVTIALHSEKIISILPQRDVNMNNECMIKRVRLYPEEGRSAGTSMYGKMKAIQDGSSQMFSLLMNIAIICMMPWYFYEQGAGVSGQQLIKPGGGIEVKDVTKIKFPEFKVNPRQYIEFINLWFSLWEKVGGMSDPQIGRPTSTKKTATEILSVIEEGNIKHSYQATTFKEEFLSIIRLMYDLYYQYMPYDKTLKLPTGETVPFPRIVMRRPQNMRLTGSTEKANKLIERKENEDVFNMLRNDPLVDPIKVVTDLLESYGRKDTQNYIKPEIGQLMQVIGEDPNVLQKIIEAVQEYMTQAQGGQGGEGGGQPV